MKWASVIRGRNFRTITSKKGPLFFFLRENCGGVPHSACIKKINCTRNEQGILTSGVHRGEGRKRKNIK